MLLLSKRSQLSNIGLDITNEEQQTRGIFGVRYLLPLLLDSTVRIDTGADLRIILDREVQPTERLSAFSGSSNMIRRAGGSGKPWAIMTNKWFSLVGQYYSELGGGGGIKISL